MGKAGIELDFVEMHAIKHALQNVVRKKKQRVEELNVEIVTLQNKDAVLEKDKLNKDIQREDRLIGKFEAEIEEFREKNRIPRK